LGSSCFLSVRCCGEAFYGLGVEGFGVLFLLFGFSFLPSVAPERKYSAWFAEGLESTFGAGSRWAVLSVYCGVEKSYTG
jgi:hypothetical protein